MIGMDLVFGVQYTLTVGKKDYTTGTSESQMQILRARTMAEWYLEAGVGCLVYWREILEATMAITRLSPKSGFLR